MKKILIHTHIYYPQLWREIKEIIENFNEYESQLYITMPKDNLYLKEEMLLFRPDAHIVLCENKGYDIAPFCEVLQQVELENFSYIVKLHTKKNQAECTHVNTFYLEGSSWRNTLLEPFRTKKSIANLIEKLEKNNKIALHAHYKLIVSKEASSRAKKKIEKFFQQHQLAQRKFSYVAGTMFIAKASAFHTLKKMNFRIDDFPQPEVGKADLAHLVERLLGYSVYVENMEIQDLITPVYVQKISTFFARFMRFLYQNHRTENKHIIKIFRIPVYFKRK